jgi:biopolymer transport protein ExbB
MAGETTVTDNPYGIEALWTQSDYVGKGVFVILIVMSLWSWLVMINKWLDQRMLRKVANEAEKSFWSAGSIQEGIGKLKGKVNPFRDIAQDGIQAVEHHRRSAARDVTSNIELADWVRTHIDKRTTMLQSSLQSGMVVLASVGATAPFVGLFGTVVGIINAFTAMASSGSGGIGSVSAGIAEALITTAIGLAVAIVAVWMFNYFQGQLEFFGIEMQNSSSELIDFFLKRQGQGTGQHGNAARQ